MNEAQEIDLTVDKEMLSVVNRAIGLQGRKYIFRDGAWHRLSSEQKEEILLNVIEKIVEMEELFIKRIDAHGKKCASGLGKNETSIERLIYILKKWKHFKEQNGCRPVIVEYVLFEEPKNI